MNILITDDHPIVLAGIRQIVETALPESRIRQAATAGEALAIIEAGMVDILIADLELNGESGIRLIHRVHDIQPNVKVLVYTMHEEVWVVRQLLEADPDGIVLKADDTEELERAFAALLQRGIQPTAELDCCIAGNALEARSGDSEADGKRSLFDRHRTASYHICKHRGVPPS